MSTRGAIGMRQPDGSVRAVYVHHDAYVAGVGAIPATHEKILKNG
ncbi:hypothetical protein SDC9_114322 [bioreactor metagenome]|uniref:Uncharacterized protein n=1 Tax=bioreactor metagenome TaxID=1076179 RepID=A0A645BPN0_9ZZZZ